MGAFLSTFSDTDFLPLPKIVIDTCTAMAVYFTCLIDFDILKSLLPT